MSLCMIVASQNQHWVLDRIAKEIGSRYGKEVSYCYDLDNIPTADNYFVTHYSLLPKVLLRVNPAKAHITCFFTHESVPISAMKDYMNLCYAVVTENMVEFRHLIEAGINPDLLHTVIECSDNHLFRPHSRTGKGKVLISSACYARKNPRLLNEIIKLSPDMNFKVIGKDWNGNLIQLPNVEYLDNLPYENYPEEYGKCDVFLSCATLEGGGPGGLIEAMHSNLFPVVSDTGNSREYIMQGYNGFIFPIDSKPEAIVSIIKDAYKASPQDSLPYNDIWQTVQHYTWDYYAVQMKEIIDGLTDHSENAFDDL
jgi:glycosyltransferase involved in cell wall biosynthesis